MIIKSFEVDKIKLTKNNLILLYGSNQGHKNQVINELFIKIFNGQISRLDESEILNNYEEFISSLINKSLFEDHKLIIVSRTSEKIIKLVNEILERKVENIKIILNSDNLEKKSKLRALFEKEKNLTCIPFYEDNEKNLSSLAQTFFRNKKIKVSQEIINVLVGRSRGDRANLFNELNKIEILSITKKNIDLDDVLKLTNLSENYSVFELVENYLAKNKRQVSKILNENNFANDECILILRTILNRSKRLLKLKESENETGNIDLTISSFKPPIFWKEKETVKKQIEIWETNKIEDLISETSDIECTVKKNPNISVKVLTNFILDRISV